MRLVETRKTRLSVAVMLKDDLTPEKQVVGDVFLKISGTNKPLLRHDTGYFLLVDMPEGKCSVVAWGEFYNEQVFIIDTKSLNPKQPVIDLFLKPDANSPVPVPEEVTMLKGKTVAADNKPVAGALIKIKDMPENTVSIEDGTFSIRFSTITSDTNTALNITKDGFKAKNVPVLLKKGVVTDAGIVKLAKK